MLNALIEAFATVIVANVTAFQAMKERDVKELLAQMTALDMADAHTSRTYPMLLFLRTIFMEISRRNYLRLSIITNGMDPKLVDVSVTLNTEMSIAPRECASMVLM